MANTEWLPEAKADLQRLYAFIARHNPDAARRAITTIIDSVGQLTGFPEMGRPWEPDLAFRELVVGFGARNYVVRYRGVGTRIIIVRVWHGLEDRD